MSAGTRVEISFQLLTPAQRALGLPDDTAAVSYDARVRGVLLSPSRRGGQASIRTQAGRELTGTLDVIEPADAHSFGRPHQALVDVANAIAELREELR